MANFRMADPGWRIIPTAHFWELDSIGPFYVEALIRPIGLWIGKPFAVTQDLTSGSPVNFRLA